jgi:hypothetical protein
VCEHYHRADDEARTLVQSALANAGDLAVTTTELRVTFAPLSSPHRTAALAALCVHHRPLRRECSTDGGGEITASVTRAEHRVRTRQACEVDAADALGRPTRLLLFDRHMDATNKHADSRP